MTANGLAVVVMTFSVGGVQAQPSPQSAVKFGNELVTLKFSNVQADEERQRLWAATNDAVDEVEQERLWRIRWEDYGEATALQSLAIYHLERGDLVSAYAHLFAADKLAKWYETAVTEPVEPAPGLGTHMPPGPLLKRHFAEIEADMKLVGEKLTPSQRAAGVKLAAALVRNNPNCCALP